VPDPDARLAKAEFWTKTGDDNKDHDTQVYVTVVTADDAFPPILLASIEGADASGRDATEYNNGSDHTIKLVVHSDQASYSMCRKFKFKIGACANGNDTWKIARARVTLYFSNGLTIYQDFDSQTLTSSGSAYTETSWSPP
jgi:hypothetical protein